MDEEANPYAVLGVAPSADDAAIRAAYAAHIRNLTPEDGRSLGHLADLRLQLINSAYEILANPELRARWDATRSVSPPKTAVPPSQPAHAVQPPLVSDIAVPPARSAPQIGGGLPFAAWAGAVIAVAAALLALFGAPHLGSLALSQNGPSATAASTPATGDSAPAQTLVLWTAAESGDPHTYNVGRLSITLSSRPGIAGAAPRPALSFSDGDGAPFVVVGQAGGANASARFGVGKIDPEGGEDQVLFLSTTDGAHCCTVVQLLERRSGAWRSKDLGAWGGQALTAFPTDIDGDGVVDLAFADERFAYAFGPYADAAMPPRIFNVVKGKTVEVSSAPGFQKLYLGQIDAARTSCMAHINGACAAFVALASRLGSRDEAWQTMLTAYDRSSADFPAGCRAARGGAVCPQGAQFALKSFPAALAWFLADSSYPFWPGGPANPMRAPSFDCTRVKELNLKLICATPSLSVADRELAAAYERALAVSADPGALRADQRAWIAQRSMAAPDIDFLQLMYTGRINVLR